VEPNVVLPWGGMTLREVHLHEGHQEVWSELVWEADVYLTISIQPLLEAPLVLSVPEATELPSEPSQALFACLAVLADLVNGVLEDSLHLCR
jgi:hypothetical protein